MPRWPSSRVEEANGMTETNLDSKSGPLEIYSVWQKRIQVMLMTT